MRPSRDEPLPDDEGLSVDREAMATMAFVLALRARGVRDLAVLGAMERVPRDLFAPPRFRDLARTDMALPLACGQTMTAPGAIATMLAALGLAPGQRVLEVGTGSGYVTALLAFMGCTVVSVERFATLATEAAARLPVVGLGPDRARVVCDDGTAPDIAGLPPGAVFDRILVDGALSAVPAPLVARLAPGGRLVGGIAAGSGGVRLAVVVPEVPEPRLDGPLRVARLLPGRALAL